MAQKEIEINENTTVKELLRSYPGSAKVLLKLGFDCLTCKGADEETLRFAAWMHGYDEKELIKILKRELAKRRGKK